MKPDVDPCRHVVGMTSVDSRRLFVLRYPSKQKIEVYNTTTFQLQQMLNAAGLVDHWLNGLTACVINNCLYINDYLRSEIFSMKLTAENEVSKWRVADRWPTGLSLNAASNLLVTCGANKIVEFTPSGLVVREISLQSENVKLSPRHAVQLSDDRLIVCGEVWSTDNSPYNDVVEVDSYGRLITSYKSQSTTHYRFSEPRRLALTKAKHVGAFLWPTSRTIKS